MTQEEFKKAFAALNIEYKHELKDLTPNEIQARMRLWYEEFKSVDYLTFANAIKQIIRTSKFFPKISEVFEILKSEHVPKLDIDAEFQNAVNVIKNNPIRTLYYTCPNTKEFKAHITTLDDVLNKLNTTTAYAVKCIGVARMLNLDDRVWVKKEFAEHLQSARSEQASVIAKIGLGGGIEHEPTNCNRLKG